MTRTASFLLCILLLNSCAVKKQVEEVSMSKSPELLFVTYRVYYKNDVYFARILDTIFKEGKLKEIVGAKLEAIPGNFMISQLDKSYKELWKIYVPDAMTKNVEFIDKSGQFQKRQIKMDSAFISQRLTLETNAVAIRLSRINKKSKPEILLTTKFNK